MTEQMVVYLFREAFYTTLLVSAPMLLISLIVGLLIAVFQAATSIQEITLTFVPKIIVVAIVAVLN
jgi:flagellar biosynthetic protein FliQ